MYGGPQLRSSSGPVESLGHPQRRSSVYRSKTHAHYGLTHDPARHGLNNNVRNVHRS